MLVLAAEYPESQMADQLLAARYLTSKCWKISLLGRIDLPEGLFLWAFQVSCRKSLFAS